MFASIFRALKGVGTFKPVDEPLHDEDIGPYREPCEVCGTSGVVDASDDSQEVCSQCNGEGSIIPTL